MSVQRSKRRGKAGRRMSQPATSRQQDARPALGLAADAALAHGELAPQSLVPRTLRFSRAGEEAGSADLVLQTPTAPPQAPRTTPEGVWRERIPSTETLRQRGQEALEATWTALRRVTLEGWLWTGVLLLATVLRFWQLGAKPLHHDESMHAYYSLLFAREPSSYEYNPLLHGPFQFHAVGLVFSLILDVERIFRAGGPSGHPWITDATARIVPASFGVGIVALPLLLRRELGRAGALIAALLLAVSPAFVYFSRFLREDIYFNFFMFAMVVCAVRFLYASRMQTGYTMRWLVALSAATILAYATFEGIFLTFVIFGAFLAVVAVWELALSVAPLLPATLTDGERLAVSRAGLLAALGIVGGVVGLVLMRTMHSLTTYILAHPTQSDLRVGQLENDTFRNLLIVSIVISLAVAITITRQILREERYAFVSTDETAEAEAPPPTLRERWLTRLRPHFDAERQPLLRLFTVGGWEQWFVAYVVGLLLFVALYSIVPGPASQAGSLLEDFRQGVGRGIWQGLYYWLQQQQVARGGQPWYYYLMLLPLYEQLAVVFGLGGVVYAVLRPTRFRLFLAWWFIGSLAIYSWAGEKMPWLSIHIVLPMLLLSALLLDRLLREAVVFVGEARASGTLRRPWQALPLLTPQARRRSVGALVGLAAALVLLVPMVHSMLLLAYQDPADGPREMMVYVQTTPDVDLVMQKIDAADRQLYGGRHQLPVAVGVGEEWPFYWYLRNYWMENHPGQYASFSYTPNAQTPPADVLILTTTDAQTFLQQHPTGYAAKTYRLRSWFDESYKPAPSPGLGPYLSYGSNPPPNAKFDVGRTAARLWSWLWVRQPLGDTHGSYDFVLVVRDGLPIQP